MLSKPKAIFTALLLCCMFFGALATAGGSFSTAIGAALQIEEIPAVTDGSASAAPDTKPLESPRLIVVLDSEPLAAAFVSAQVQAAGINGQLDVNASAAQAYVAQLQAEQAAFVGQMQSVLSEATVGTFINEMGIEEEATYQIVLNGMAVDVGSMDRAVARERLARIDGVKAVYLDQPYATQLYTSTALINAPVVWNSPETGGVENAGAGVKFASMDGGVHKDAPMMDGTGYSYPAGFEPNGKGLTANNNGKIIASRVYFRSWDPPSAGDENPWPGENGTSHGIHTASTAAGGCVDDVDYLGLNVGSMCGVAPAAYVMSYRVFYASVNGNESFYTAEGVAALEDIVADGADVVQNSWGEGPITEGGEFDPIDTALINAVKAGVFVSMSAGNSGPGKGTGDHPSDDYINVAASTSGGTLAAGNLNIVGNAELQGIDFGTADFGESFELAQVFNFDYVTAASVDAANVTGCAPFTADAFAGKAAMISRGGCFFSDKVYNAEQAGATFAIIYNNGGGDEIINMACGGDYCGDGTITIPSIFIGENNGNSAVAHFDTVGAANAKLELSTVAFQAGNTPDQIIGFSSRGPAPGGTLKPDIAAPGVNILAQGYTNGAEGEARHLGYGQASGTSMAGPHVAGAAVLIRQRYPSWSNDAIKSAMMSTAKYMDIYTADGTPAQPLDMGSGRLDVAAAMDPGVILDPPSLSFSTVASGTQKTITVQVTNISDSAETYALSTLAYTNSFTMTTEMAGIMVSEASISLAPGETKSVDVTFDASAGNGIGDNQGYILMTGDTHNAHMAAWARVVPAVKTADVLILDNDFSTLAPVAGTFAYDYLWYYTSALDELGYTYEVIDVDGNFGGSVTIPEAAILAGYKAILHVTGDNYRPDGTFSIPTGLTTLDRDRLVEYLNGGGTIIGMGQDLSSVLDAATPNAEVGNRDFYYVYRLGSNYIQDSVTGSGAAGEFGPELMMLPSDEAPAALANVAIDLTRPRKFAASGPLSGDNEVPAVVTETSGSFTVRYDIDQNQTAFEVTVAPTPTTPITVTGAHIHMGAADANGPVVRNLDLEGSFPVFVTDTLSLSGVLSPSLTAEEVTEMVNGNLYVNIHTTANPSGEIRGQIAPEPVVNQAYVDELDNEFHDGSQDPNSDGTTSESNLGSVALFEYGGPYNVEDGTTGLAHRDQPSLERPGTDYSGRSIYTSFGLEGMAESFNASVGITPTSRADLLGLFLTWAWSEPSTVVISDTTGSDAALLKTFSASLAEGEAVQYRWDFGDGSDFVISGNDTAGRQYFSCGTYTVRAEVTDALGNVAIGSQIIDIEKDCSIDLKVTLSQSTTGLAEPGSVLTILVDYENVGAGMLSSTIDMTVPQGATFNAAGSGGDVRGASNPWSCADGSPAGTVCQLQVTALAAGAGGSVPFAVTLDGQLPSDATAIEFSADVPGVTDGVTGATGEALIIPLAAPTAIETGAEPTLNEKIFVPLFE